MQGGKGTERPATEILQRQNKHMFIRYKDKHYYGNYNGSEVRKHERMYHMLRTHFSSDKTPHTLYEGYTQI